MAWLATPSTLTALGRGSLGLSFPSRTKENWNWGRWFGRNQTGLTAIVEATLP